MPSTNGVPAPAARPRGQPRPRPKPERRYRWVTAPTEQYPFGILYIRVGKEEGFYFVQPIKSDFGKAFEVTKLDGIGGTVYHALLDGKQSSCTCKGFAGHALCKHRDVLQVLLDAGQLHPPRIEADTAQTPTANPAT
jgi:hypothetical protein